jgi:hypothetical protein
MWAMIPMFRTTSSFCCLGMVVSSSGRVAAAYQR